ncbi:unnamed protein product [Colias eurytheme]|nr:unnamed protein product [Colias eurytheme]
MLYDQSIRRFKQLANSTRLLAGSYGKSTPAATEFMVPWRGEWTPETCAAFFKDAASIEDGESTNDPVVVVEPASGT